MNITVFGTGYVGLVTGACLASLDHHVVCVDTDAKKIATLLAGGLPIFEKGLDTIVREGIKAGRLSFTTDYNYAARLADCIIMAVGTPSRPDGTADLSYIYEAMRQISSSCHDHKWILIKSTVPVGTTEKLQHMYSQFEFICNPEFLRQGNAVSDFLSPDRIIAGVQSDEAFAVIKEIYHKIDAPLLRMNPAAAELTKYAANAFLATKISFINMFANLCEQVGADVEDVARGIGYDHRIGREFLGAGIGFGGSCFPKDLTALLALGRDHSVELPIIDAVLAVNEGRPHHIVDLFMAANQGSVKGKKAVCWGVTFKAGTDDLRASPALKVIDRLTAAGVMVTVYDPVIRSRTHPVLKQVTVAGDLYGSVKEKDALFILTDWRLFREADWPFIQSQMRQPHIFDGRNLLSQLNLPALGFDYYPIGKPFQKANRLSYTNP